MTIFGALLIFSGVLFVILLYIWSTYNSFIRKRNQVKTDFSDIDIQVRKRASLVERLANMVREYAKHEKETFENVARARSALDTSKTVKEAAQAESMFTQTLRSLFAVVEDYPKLQASENFKQLRQDLKETENLIAGYREEYNQTVQGYNNAVQTFPNLLVAALFKFEEEELFQAAETSKS